MEPCREQTDGLLALRRQLELRRRGASLPIARKRARAQRSIVREVGAR